MYNEELKNKYKVIFVLGPPGSGKNTQCDKIVERYSLIHFSAGDLLREEVNIICNKKVKNQTEQGNYINEIIKEGKIVPVKITCKLIENAMSRHNKEEKVFIIDGFPRNDENYQGWCQSLKENAYILSIVFLECPEDVCIERILKRSEMSGRVDDNKSSLTKRFKTFNHETIPLIKRLEEENKINIIRINANQEKDNVFSSISVELDKIVVNK